MKKILFYLIAFIFSCLFTDSLLNYSIGKQIDNQPLYHLSFASIGANLLECRLDCWAKIKTASTFEEMDEELIEILTYLDLPTDKNKFLHHQEKNSLQVKYQISGNGQENLFTIQTSPADNETHFLLTSISSQDDLKIKQNSEKLKRKLSAKSYFTYKGAIPLRTESNANEQLLQVIMKCLNAEVKDVYKFEGTTSMAGYSPLIKKQVIEVTAGTSKYNVQAAIKGEDKNKTFVYLGFPLLLNNY